MDIDIRRDRTCDLPVTSLLQDELLNRQAALPLKETSAVNNAIHISVPSEAFFLAFTICFFHISYIWGFTSEAISLLQRAFGFQFPLQSSELGEKLLCCLKISPSE